MDPQATWGRLLRAYEAQDWPEVDEAASDLLAWLDRGGFPPVTTTPALGDAWDRALARAACLFAREHAAARYPDSDHDPD